MKNGASRNRLSIAARKALTVAGNIDIMDLVRSQNSAGFTTTDVDTFNKRNVVERCLLWLKECRRVATRFEKLAVIYAAMVNVAAIRRLLRKIATV